MEKKERVEFESRDIWYMVRNWLVGDGEESRIGDDKELWRCLSDDLKEVFEILDKRSDMSLVMIRIWVREGVRELGYEKVKNDLEVFLEEVDWVREEWSNKELENGLSDLVFG